MKKFIISFLAVFLILSLSLSAFAAEGEETTTETTVEATETVEDTTLVGTSVYSLSPVTAEDATGLKAVLLSFIGSYDAVVVEYEYQNTNTSNVSYLREVQPDYVWLCSCALLVVMIFCLFRLGGSLLCRK